MHREWRRRRGSVALGALALSGMAVGFAGGGEGGGRGRPGLGVNASLRGFRPFPADSPWNTAIDRAPVDPNSDTLISSIGRTKSLHPDFGANWNGMPNGIPYIVV